MTIQDYDIGELKKSLNQTLMGVAITSFINYKFEIVQPLFIQTFISPKTILMSPLAQIHIFGFRPEGKLQRPFKPKNPFGFVFFLFFFFYSFFFFSF